MPDIGATGANVSDWLAALGENPEARRAATPGGGQRQQINDRVMRRYMGAMQDPNTPQAYRQMLAQLLQGLAQEDRYIGNPAQGEIGPRPAGAR